jgi:DNA-binding transcriptional ArsR family regulator
MQRAIVSIENAVRPEIATHVGNVCRAISSQSRRQILRSLSTGAMSVNEIASEMSISRPAVSQHLRILRAARLVSFERKGNYTFYRLDLRSLGKLRQFIATLGERRRRSLA